MSDVALPQRPASDADGGGDSIDHTSHRELRLVRSEPAERTARRIVGARGNCAHVDGTDPIRARRVPGRSFENLHADRRVGTRIADRAYAHAGQRAVVVARGPILEANRMTFGMNEQ